MRNLRFTFLCTKEERRLISKIAQKLNRSQGDAIRFLIRVAAQELAGNEETFMEKSRSNDISLTEEELHD